MPRADLLRKLVRAAAAGDAELFRRATDALISDERDKGHHILAEQLEDELKVRRPAAVSSPPSQLTGVDRLLFDLSPQRPLCSLSLEESTATSVSELIEEHERVDLLRSFNLEPRHRVLLVGPPGNGKTSLAEAIAHELAVPFFVVRYEGLMGSYLGETASRLSELFDYVRTRRCVLFLDEFDAISKERGDPQETGEVKRVVSSLLLQIDRLPSHSLVVAATNHAELLDRAVWRRFEVRLALPMPSASIRAQFVTEKLQESGIQATMSREALARALGPLSFSELEEFAFDVKRRVALAGPDADPSGIIRARIKQWKKRPKP